MRPANLPSLNVSTVPSGTDADDVGLDSHDPLSTFGRVRNELELLEHLIDEELNSHPGGPSRVAEAMCMLARAVGNAESVHREAIVRADALSAAQAEALVHSAEVIEELERTKIELVDARRQSERDREARVNLLSRVFENAREGVVILNADGRIQEVNPVFCKIARKDDRCLIGLGLDSTLEWSFADYRNVLSAALSGEASTEQVAVARSDSEEQSYLVSFSPVQNEGEPPQVIVMFSDVTDIDRTQRHLQQQALHDQLTGLPNRRFFRERIQTVIDECSRDQAAFAVCFIDLDDFKHVNDSFGHHVGDDLLIEVSQRIVASAGPDAFVARFGGDEFAILLSRTNEDLLKTVTVTDRVLRSLRNPIDLAGTEVRVSASIGVTESPQQSSDADELLQFADVAMYAAKKAGRNQIRMFTERMWQEVEQQHRIQRQLSDAIDEAEIAVHYQPQVDLQTGECVGCEALARWRLPDGREISPAEFVPVAERSGLITPLGESVLSAVCRDLVEWQGRGCRPDRVAINVSPRQLYGRTFVQRVLGIIEKYGAQPDWLTLEITENAMMENLPQAMRTIHQFSDRGFHIALDDFGMGYSSLSYLKDFHVDYLKIDRSFIVDLPGEDRVNSIVESVIHLARGRELSVVAEGVETERQYQALKEMGCDIGQGYLIARPLKSNALEAYLEQQAVRCS